MLSADQFLRSSSCFRRYDNSPRHQHPVRQHCADGRLPWDYPLPTPGRPCRYSTRWCDCPRAVRTAPDGFRLQHQLHRPLPHNCRTWHAAFQASRVAFSPQNGHRHQSLSHPYISLRHFPYSATTGPRCESPYNLPWHPAQAHRHSSVPWPPPRSHRPLYKSPCKA